MNNVVSTIKDLLLAGFAATVLILGVVCVIGTIAGAIWLGSWAASTVLHYTDNKALSVTAGVVAMSWPILTLGLFFIIRQDNNKD